jgi:uncharacterized protein
MFGKKIIFKANINFIVMDRKIRLYNPWWEINKIPAELYSESTFTDFESIEKILENKKILTIFGTRQIGKTYVLYSIINHLFKKGTSPQNILFLSMDDRIIDLEAAISFYERIILKKNINNCNETFYVFLDEIQLLENWQEIVKHYIDQSYPIKFILASSSINYFRQDNLSLYEKDYEEIRVLPIGLVEYMKFKKVNFNLPKLNFNDLNNFSLIMDNKLGFINHFNDLDSVLNSFLIQGGFVQYLKDYNPIIKTQKIMSQVVDLSIFKDITAIYDIDKPSKLKDLLLYIARNTGSIFQIDYLSKLLGIPAQLLENYLNYLESSFLIHSSFNLNYDPNKSQFCPRKLYFSDLGVRNSIVGDQSVNIKDVNNLIDNAVYLHLLRLKKKLNFEFSFWRKDTFNVDIVLSINKQIIPIEINYKSKRVRNQERNIARFFDVTGCEKGIIISKDTYELIAVENKEILVIPAWLILLLN